MLEGAHVVVEQEPELGAGGEEAEDHERGGVRRSEDRVAGAGEEGRDQRGDRCRMAAAGQGLRIEGGAGGVNWLEVGEDCDDTCSVNIGPAVSLLWPMSDRATLAATARRIVRSRRIRSRSSTSPCSPTGRG